MRQSLVPLGTLLLLLAAHCSATAVSQTPPRASIEDFAQAWTSPSASSVPASARTTPSYPSTFSLTMRVDSWMSDEPVLYRFAMDADAGKAVISTATPDPTRTSAWRKDLGYGVTMDHLRCAHFPFTDSQGLPDVPAVPEGAVFVDNVACRLADGSRATCSLWNHQAYYDTFFFFHDSQPVLVEEWLPRQDILAYRYTPLSWTDSPAEADFDLPDLCYQPPSAESMAKSFTINRAVWTHTNPEDEDDYQMTWVGSIIVSASAGISQRDFLYKDWKQDKWMGGWVQSDEPHETSYIWYEQRDCEVYPTSMERPVPERFRSGAQFVGMEYKDCWSDTLWCERWEAQIGGVTEVVLWDSRAWGPVRKIHYDTDGEPLREWATGWFGPGEPDPASIEVIDACRVDPEDSDPVSRHPSMALLPLHLGRALQGSS